MAEALPRGNIAELAETLQPGEQAVIVNEIKDSEKRLHLDTHRFGDRSERIFNYATYKNHHPVYETGIYIHGQIPDADVNPRVTPLSENELLLRLPADLDPDSEEYYLKMAELVYSQVDKAPLAIKPHATDGTKPPSWAAFDPQLQTMLDAKQFLVMTEPAHAYHGFSAELLAENDDQRRLAAATHFVMQALFSRDEGTRSLNPPGKQSNSRTFEYVDGQVRTRVSKVVVIKEMLVYEFKNLIYRTIVENRLHPKDWPVERICKRTDFRMNLYKATNFAGMRYWFFQIDPEYNFGRALQHRLWRNEIENGLKAPRDIFKMYMAMEEVRISALARNPDLAIQGGLAGPQPLVELDSVLKEREAAGEAEDDGAEDEAAEDNGGGGRRKKKKQGEEQKLKKECARVFEGLGGIGFWPPGIKSSKLDPRAHTFQLNHLMYRKSAKSRRVYEIDPHRQPPNIFQSAGMGEASAKTRIAELPRKQHFKATITEQGHLMDRVFVPLAGTKWRAGLSAREMSDAIDPTQDIGLEPSPLYPAKILTFYNTLETAMGSDLDRVEIEETYEALKFKFGSAYMNRYKYVTPEQCNINNYFIMNPRLACYEFKPAIAMLAWRVPVECDYRMKVERLYTLPQCIRFYDEHKMLVREDALKILARQQAEGKRRADEAAARDADRLQAQRLLEDPTGQKARKHREMGQSVHARTTTLDRVGGRVSADKIWEQYAQLKRQQQQQQQRGDAASAQPEQRLTLDLDTATMADAQDAVHAARDDLARKEQLAIDMDRWADAKQQYQLLLQSMEELARIVPAERNTLLKLLRYDRMELVFKPMVRQGSTSVSHITTAHVNAINGPSGEIWSHLTGYRNLSVSMSIIADRYQYIYSTLGIQNGTHILEFIYSCLGPSTFHTLRGAPLHACIIGPPGIGKSHLQSRISNIRPAAMVQGGDFESAKSQFSQGYGGDMLVTVDEAPGGLSSDPSKCKNLQEKDAASLLKSKLGKDKAEWKRMEKHIDGSFQTISRSVCTRSGYVFCLNQMLAVDDTSIHDRLFLLYLIANMSAHEISQTILTDKLASMGRISVPNGGGMENELAVVKSDPFILQRKTEAVFDVCKAIDAGAVPEPYVGNFLRHFILGNYTLHKFGLYTRCSMRLSARAEEAAYCMTMVNAVDMITSGPFAITIERDAQGNHVTIPWKPDFVAAAAPYLCMSTELAVRAMAITYREMCGGYEVWQAIEWAAMFRGCMSPWFFDAIFKAPEDPTDLDPSKWGEAWRRIRDPVTKDIVGYKQHFRFAHPTLLKLRNPNGLGAQGSSFIKEWDLQRRRYYNAGLYSRMVNLGARSKNVADGMPDISETTGTIGAHFLAPSDQADAQLAGDPSQRPARSGPMHPAYTMPEMMPFFMVTRSWEHVSGPSPEGDTSNTAGVGQGSTSAPPLEANPRVNGSLPSGIRAQKRKPTPGVAPAGKAKERLEPIFGTGNLYRKSDGSTMRRSLIRNPNFIILPGSIEDLAEKYYTLMKPVMALSKPVGMTLFEYAKDSISVNVPVLHDLEDPADMPRIKMQIDPTTGEWEPVMNTIPVIQQVQDQFLDPQGNVWRMQTGDIRTFTKISTMALFVFHPAVMLELVLHSMEHANTVPCSVVIDMPLQNSPMVFHTVEIRPNPDRFLADMSNKSTTGDLSGNDSVAMVSSTISKMRGCNSLNYNNPAVLSTLRQMSKSMQQEATENTKSVGRMAAIDTAIRIMQDKIANGNLVVGDGSDWAMQQERTEQTLDQDLFTILSDDMLSQKLRDGKVSADHQNLLFGAPAFRSELGTDAARAAHTVAITQKKAEDKAREAMRRKLVQQLGPVKAKKLQAAGVKALAPLEGFTDDQSQWIAYVQRHAIYSEAPAEMRQHPGFPGMDELSLKHALLEQPEYAPIKVLANDANNHDPREEYPQDVIRNYRLIRQQAGLSVPPTEDEAGEYEWVLVDGMIQEQKYDKCPKMRVGIRTLVLNENRGKVKLEENRAAYEKARQLRLSTFRPGGPDALGNPAQASNTTTPAPTPTRNGGPTMPPPAPSPVSGGRPPRAMSTAFYGTQALLDPEASQDGLVHGGSWTNDLSQDGMEFPPADEEYGTEQLPEQPRLHGEKRKKTSTSGPSKNSRTTGASFAVPPARYSDNEDE